MVLMMVVPFQSFAYVAPLKLPEKLAEDFNGMFEIEVKMGISWLNAGNISFGKFQETKEIDLGEYLKGENGLIKITQNGGGAAYLDAVFLNGTIAIKANGSEGKVLNKLSKEDLDITPIDDGIILEYVTNEVGGMLSVTGRIENEVISKEPLQFPLANNYKHKNQITDFYSYKLNSNIGTIIVDGELDEVKNLEVFAQEYQVPGSGHPAGDTFFWVMNDDENLYVTMDFTPDNTYDGDKDYAKVYVNTSEGIKEFKVSVPDTTYGNAGFTYTDKVVYEHKVYEFVLPLSEIGNITDELELAFVGYGTAALPPEVGLPRLAYDPENKIYLSVFQQNDMVDGYELHIYGQFVYLNENGTETVCPEFLISNEFSRFPDVAYDSANNVFLVVWEQYNPEDSLDFNSITGKAIDVNSVDDYMISPSINIISYSYEEQYNNVGSPTIAYDNKEKQFLVVWEDSFVVYINDVLEDRYCIKGKFIKFTPDNPPTISDDPLIISIPSYARDEYPAVCYSNYHDSFLVVWVSFDESRMLQGNIIKSTELNPEPVNFNDLIIIESGKNTYAPNVSINNDSKEFFVTWGAEHEIYGANVGLSLEASTPEIITPDSSYAYAYHSTSFYNGEGSMLCLWNNFEIDTNYGYIKMKTVGESEIYETYNPERTDTNERGYNYFNLIDSCGDGNGEILVAYGRYKTENYYQRSSIALNTDVETYPIGYRFVSDTTPDYSDKPYLEFVNDPYRVQIGNTLEAEVNYFDGENNIDVTDNVTYVSLNPEIATVSTSGAITGKAVGYTYIEAYYSTYINDVATTLSAIAARVDVYKKSSPGPSPAPQIIGQIIVDGKVLKNIYEDDLVSEGGVYSFKTTKTGDNAKLWLFGSYYKQIANKTPKGTLQLVWDAASYNLPLKSEEVLKDVNSIPGSKLSIIIDKVDDKEIIESATAAVDKLSGKMVSGLVDFDVTIEGNNKKVNIDSYDLYVSRTIDKLNQLDAYTTTAMKLVEDDEVFTFAPSIFDGDTATIKYRGNGIFAIVNNPKTFSDIANHWSKVNVEKLAARNIAFGKDNSLFVPNDFVTRAEFAVMITRALGITEEEGAMNFDDVKGWFAEDISTAYDAGLINGKGDGNFYPNEKIQRKDMSVIIHNALKFADKDENAKNIESILSMFVDSSEISDYARESTAVCADAGIIMGRDTKEFDPYANATRAEASAIIERMLRYLEFIN